MAINFSSPFLLVRERTTSAVVLPNQSPSLALMLATAQRGPINRLVEVVSPDDYRAVYGNDDGGDGFEGMLGAFKNGASSLLVNRIAHYTDPAVPGSLTAVSAEVTLLTAGTTDTAAQKTSANVGPYDLSTANAVATPINFIVAIDGAGADTATVTATAATETAPAVPGGVGTTGNTLTFAVHGINIIYTVPATPPTTVLDWANDIANQLPGVAGSVVGGVVVLTTDRQGTSATVVFGSSTGTAGVDSGFTGAGTPVAGTGNVADVSAVTATELAGILQAAWTGGGGTVVTVQGVTPNETLQVDTVTTGASASIGVVTEPVGTAGGTNIVDFVLAGAVVGTSSGTPSVDSLKIIATSEGEHGNSLAVTTIREDRIAGNITADVPLALTSEFKIDSTVLLRVGVQFLAADTTTGGELRGVVKEIVGNVVRLETPATPSAALLAANTPTVTKETFGVTYIVDGASSSTFTNLSMSQLDQRFYVGTVLGTDPKQLDARVRLFSEDQVPPLTNDADPRPVDITGTPLAGGLNGGAAVNTDYIGSPAGGTGLNAANKTNAFSMALVPGVETLEVHKGSLDYATLREDHVALMDAPEGLTPDQVVTYVTTTANLFGTFGIIYAGRPIVLRGSTGIQEGFPAVGHVAGIYARVDQEFNVSEPPAGTTKAQVLGILGIDDDNPYGDKAQRDKVYPVGVNPIVSFPGRGTALFGQNTLDPSSDLGAIGVRRAFIKLRKDIEEVLDFVIFRINDAALRREATERVNAYLRDQWNAGVIKGEVEDEAFFVICDKTNNTAAVVNARRFVMRVGVNVLPGTDFALVELERDTRALEQEGAAA